MMRKIDALRKASQGGCLAVRLEVAPIWKTRWATVVREAVPGENNGEPAMHIENRASRVSRGMIHFEVAYFPWTRTIQYHIHPCCVLVVGYARGLPIECRLPFVTATIEHKVIMGQKISNILKACVELMAGSDCAMQAKAHMGALGPVGQNKKCASKWSMDARKSISLTIIDMVELKMFEASKAFKTNQSFSKDLLPTSTSLGGSRIGALLLVALLLCQLQRC